MSVFKPKKYYQDENIKLIEENNNLNNELTKLKDEITTLKEEAQKLSVIVNKYNEQKEKYRNINKEKFDKLKGVKVFCTDCNYSVAKTSWINHANSDKHINNVKLKNVKV
jgi:hypothetical protein